MNPNSNALRFGTTDSHPMEIDYATYYEEATVTQQTRPNFLASASDFPHVCPFPTQFTPFPIPPFLFILFSHSPLLYFSSLLRYNNGWNLGNMGLAKPADSGRLISGDGWIGGGKMIFGESSLYFVEVTAEVNS